MYRTTEITAHLKNIIGEKYVLMDKEEMYNYAVNISFKNISYPFAIVLPADTKEVSSIMKFCYEHEIKVKIRGGGTNVSGGCVVSEDMLMISLERLNAVVEIDITNKTVTVGAGTITENLQQEVNKHNLQIPHNISSASQSFIGGNIALSSGSPKSLKYGALKNYVLNLEVVLADGRVIWTGKNVNKNATGYNLTQLFVGSEGTLGIITKVVLKLVARKKEIVFLIPFKKLHGVFEFVNKLFLAGFDPSSMEFLDKKGYLLVLNFLNQRPLFDFDIEGLLWIEMEIDNENLSDALSQFISGEVEEDVLIGYDRTTIDMLWLFRKSIGLASVNYSTFKDIDVVVPRSESEKLLKKIENICSAFHFEYIVIGHLGDGNFHINIFGDSIKFPNWETDFKQCLVKIFNVVNVLGGTLSGEHGVGSIYPSYLKIVIPDEHIQLMKAIKKVFDCKNILNVNVLFE